MTPEKKRWLIIGVVAGSGCVALLGALLIALGLGLGGAALSRFGVHGKSAGGGCPSEAEVRETIQRKFHELYFEDYGLAKVQEVTIDIGEIKFGEMTRLQVEYGRDAEPVCPVHVVVHVHVSYSNNPSPRDLTRGERDDDTFLFYKDGFGRWTFRTGTP